MPYLNPSDITFRNNAATGKWLKNSFCLNFFFFERERGRNAAHGSPESPQGLERPAQIEANKRRPVGRRASHVTALPTTDPVRGLEQCVFRSWLVRRRSRVGAGPFLRLLQDARPAPPAATVSPCARVGT